MTPTRLALAQPAVLAAILGSLATLAATGDRLPDRPAAPAPLLESVDTRLYLIGDAGAPAEREPVFEALRAELARDPGRSQVVFLGDNIYPLGLPAPDDGGRREAERRLEAQLALVQSSGAPGIFVPGNHDWATPGAPETGWDAIRRQERHVSGRNDPGLAFLPLGGCPGPVVRDVGARLRLVVLDTEWWLREGPKPTHPSSACPEDSELEVLAALEGALAGAGTRQVVVASHHPLASGGSHGGHFGWKDHVFPLRAKKRWLWLPLPGLGSAYPLARQAGISNQDLAGTLNEKMRAALEGVFRTHPPLLHAAGHEHNLQVFRGRSARYLAISGSGYYRPASRAVTTPETLFARAASGFMRLDLASDGRARLAVLVVDREGRGSEAFSLLLE